MIKSSSLNGVMLIFSLIAAALVYALGELLLRYLANIPFVLQCGIYMTFATLLLFVAMYLAEKISPGYYIPYGRVTFGGTCAKAAAILVPCALALGLLTQLAYGFVGADAEESGLLPVDYVTDFSDDEWIPWWIEGSPEAGGANIGAGGAEVPMPLHDGLRHFYQDNIDDLHGYLSRFVARSDVMGANATFSQWAGSRRPTIPANAPSFMEIGGGDVSLAFQAIVEYVFINSIGFVNFEEYADNPYVLLQPIVRGDYRGPHGAEFLLFWEAMDAWTYACYDPCNTFYQYWNFHITDAPIPRAPVILVEVTYERPHLLLLYTGPSQDSLLRVVIQAFSLSLWGILTAIAVAIFLNNSKLFTAFVIPRAIISIVLSATFAIVLSIPGLEIGYGISLDVPMRALLAVSTCLLFLPTYRWDGYGYVYR
jgi:hypothetical protein